MASEPVKLTVVISPAAHRDLVAIWIWNAGETSSQRADNYLAFLHENIEQIETNFASGAIVLMASNYRYVTAKFSSGGHGHHIVYQIFQDRVQILRVFHTRQNWKKILEKDLS